MSRDTVKKVRQSLGEHTENAQVHHTGNTKVHLTRRQVLGWGALGAGGTLAGLKILGAVGKWLDRKYNYDEFEPRLTVKLYSDERIESLSEEQKKLISESKANGYVEVGFSRYGHPFVEVDIYQWDPELRAKNIHEKEEVPCVPIRTDGREEFTYIVDDPDLGTQIKIEVKPDYLNDLELLEKIVEAHKLDEESYRKRRESFSSFDFDSYRKYNGIKIPTECDIQMKGDPVRYEIDGLEVLVGGDKTLFAEYWLARDNFDSFAAFKEFYDKAQKIRAAESDAKAK